MAQLAGVNAGDAQPVLPHGALGGAGGLLAVEGTAALVQAIGCDVAALAP